MEIKLEKRVMKAEANRDSRITLYFFSTPFNLGNLDLIYPLSSLVTSNNFGVWKRNRRLHSSFASTFMKMVQAKTSSSTNIRIIAAIKFMPWVYPTSGS